MKIFSLRNVLGVAALYGASQYAKKHGGFRPAFDGLVAKIKDAASMKKEQTIGKAHDASVGAGAQSSQRSSYDSGGYSGESGGNGTNRRS